MRRFLLTGSAAFFFLSLVANSSAVGTAFLTIPSSPRELAFGGFTPSVTGDPSLARGNPALIVQSIPAMDVHFGYNLWFAGARGTSVLIAQPAFGSTFGFSVRHLEISDLELRTTTPTDDYLSLFKESGTTVEATWGRRLDRWRLGGTIRWIRLESYVDNSSGFGVDLGAWWPLAGGQISLAAALQNLGYMTPMREKVPSLPTALQIGGTWHMSSGPGSERSSFRSLFTAGAEFSKVHGRTIRLAGEISIDDARLTVGLRSSHRVAEVAVGASVGWRRFRFSYGVAVGSHRLGVPHLFHVMTRLP
ncbi:MAG: hypothetical protein V3U24_11190 [Candidatus Neomarinimicrobiota bacterium]